MSETDTRGKSPTDATTGIDTRRAITDRAQLNDDPTVRTIIVDVAERLDTTQADVAAQFELLERNGFVYTVGDGVEAEVRLP